VPRLLFVCVGVAAALLSLTLAELGATPLALVTTATIVVLATLLVSGQRRRDALRRTRLLLLAALSCAFISGVMSALYQIVTHHLPPHPWVGDAVSLAYVPFTVAGLLQVPAASRRTGYQARAFADGLLAACSLWYLLSGIAAAPHGPATGSEWATITSYAYPVGDVFVVAAGLTVLARCAAVTTRIVAWVVAGLSLVAANDIWLFVSGHAQADRGPALLYQAGLLLLVGAAASPAIPVGSPMTSRPYLGSVLGVFPFLPLFGCMVMTAQLELEHRDIPRSMVLPALLVAVGLTVRQFAGARDKQRLVDQLEDRQSALEAALRIDDLTGLANRRGFTEALEAALADQAKWPVTLILVDLNGFKLINDNHGHATGDEVLQMLGRRMSAHLRSADTIARIGGDEFAMLTCGVDEIQRTAVINRLVRCFQDPINVHETSFNVQASIGVVTGQPPETASELLAHADAAMYRTKATRRPVTSVAVLDTAGRAEIARQLQIAEEIADPDLSQFHVLYQPIVDLATGTIRGLESLMRWEHPTLGEISPNVFIPLAEQSGSITKLGAFVISTATTDFAELTRRHHRPGLSIAVNVSPRQLNRPGFVDFVLTAIREAQLRPEQVTVEVTEQAFEANLDQASDAVARLIEAGADVAVDDFGTGYSSLRYLQQLDVTVMKIDQEFVSDISTTPRTRQLVRSVVEMAAGLGLRVVAEGIASIDQLRELQELNCELGQGFLFSRPVSIGVIDGLLQSGHVYPVGLGDAAPLLPSPRRPIDPTPEPHRQRSAT
jgi:diguanylate cyclase (GGDEF)-like protein